MILLYHSALVNLHCKFAPKKQQAATPNQAVAFSEILFIVALFALEVHSSAQGEDPSER